MANHLDVTALQARFYELSLYGENFTDMTGTRSQKRSQERYQEIDPQRPIKSVKSNCNLSSPFFLPDRQSTLVNGIFREALCRSSTPPSHRLHDILYQEQLEKVCFGSRSETNSKERILWRFQIPRQEASFFDPLKLKKGEVDRQSIIRRVEPSPVKILDLPGIVNDVYIKHIAAGNGLASILLGDTNYFYSQEKGAVVWNYASKEKSALLSTVFLFDRPSMCMQSALNKTLSVIDVQAMKPVRRITLKEECYTVHHKEQSTSFFGLVNGLVGSVDMRDKRASMIGMHKARIVDLHFQRELHLLAAGDGEGVVKIWDIRKNGHIPAYMIKAHPLSCVTALKWSPWNKNQLITGGGIIDPSINVFDISKENSLHPISHINTHSQITSLLTAPSGCKELIIAHGAGNGHDIPPGRVAIWKWYKDNFYEMCQLEPHKESGISMSAAIDPSTHTLFSAGSDELLKIWNNLFSGSLISKNAQKEKNLKSSFLELSLR